MKKRFTSNTKKPKENPTPKKSESLSDGYDSDNETGTFSSWLKSGRDVELMKAFVIINSIIVFFTMSWPQMKEMFVTLYSSFTETEN